MTTDMTMDRFLVDKWIELKTKQYREQFENEREYVYASLSGALSSKLADLAVGGICREVAIQGMERDLQYASI